MSFLGASAVDVRCQLASESTGGLRKPIRLDRMYAASLPVSQRAGNVVTMASESAFVCTLRRLAWRAQRGTVS
jgi:hypothetical protein